MNSEYVRFWNKGLWHISRMVLHNSTEETEEHHGKPQSGQPSKHVCPMLLPHQPAWCILSFYANIT